MAKLLKRKNVNFYAAFYRKPAPDKETVKKRVLIGVPCGVVAILLVAGGVIYGQVIYKNMQIGKIAEYLNNEEVAAAYKEASLVAADKAAFESELKYFTKVNGSLGTYPLFTSDQITQIYATATGGTVVKGISYESTTGVVTLTAEAPKLDYAAETAATLRKLSFFSDVQYKGYESAETGIYSFEAYCVMEGGEAK